MRNDITQRFEHYSSSGVKLVRGAIVERSIRIANSGDVRRLQKRGYDEVRRLFERNTMLKSSRVSAV